MIALPVLKCYAALIAPCIVKFLVLFIFVFSCGCSNPSKWYCSIQETCQTAFRSAVHQ